MEAAYKSQLAKARDRVAQLAASSREQAISAEARKSASEHEQLLESQLKNLRAKYDKQKGKAATLEEAHSALQAAFDELKVAHETAKTKLEVTLAGKDSEVAQLREQLDAWGKKEEAMTRKMDLLDERHKAEQQRLALHDSNRLLKPPDPVLNVWHSCRLEGLLRQPHGLLESPLQDLVGVHADLRSQLQRLLHQLQKQQFSHHQLIFLLIPMHLKELLQK